MPLKFSKVVLLVVDTALVLYWVAVSVDVIPKDAAFRDYSNPIVQAWNWSFLPLDIAATAVGFLGVYLMRIGNVHGRLVLACGLTLTFCAGFMAIAFWAFRGDFSTLWWASNVLLMVVPVVVFSALVREPARNECA
ncbi:hypothetical protein GOEFS_069_00030 [Gordonia effusa NBRC 100432]|uniref:Uncharacterized protein n=1 Tax=Gordonia effusa NBRC 100432 TaxID=1077974 RepID=H0R1C6_9ACTN|nr:DUF5360 family protein [Gordonia effusa]GAB18877.1 hypothetical protein GOEFS_069_00030 [Gordonia effusa NBRC 100432]